MQTDKCKRTYNILKCGIVLHDAKLLYINGVIYYDSNEPKNNK
jgi:hypothetical protein